MQWRSGGEESVPFQSWGVSAEDTLWVTCCPSSQERFSNIFPLRQPWATNTQCVYSGHENPGPQDSQPTPYSQNQILIFQLGIIPQQGALGAYIDLLTAVVLPLVLCFLGFWIAPHVFYFEVVQFWSMKARILTGNSTVKDNISSIGNTAFW